MVRFFLLLTLFLSCKTIAPKISAEDPLYKIYKEFIIDINVWGLKPTLKLKSIEFIDAKTMNSMFDNDEEDTTIIGLCEAYKNGNSYVYIVTHREEILEPLVYHELAHCVLGADHYEDSVDLMNHILPKITNDRQFEFFKREFFNRFKKEH